MMRGHTWQSAAEVRGKWVYWNAQESPALRLVPLQVPMGPLLRTWAKRSGSSCRELMANVPTSTLVGKRYFPSRVSMREPPQQWCGGLSPLSLSSPFLFDALVLFLSSSSVYSFSTAVHQTTTSQRAENTHVLAHGSVGQVWCWPWLGITDLNQGIDWAVSSGRSGGNTCFQAHFFQLWLAEFRSWWL